MSETLPEFPSECRWGGPEGPACWNVGACGCRPFTVEEVWAEAHAEQTRRLARGIFDALADATRPDMYPNRCARFVAGILYGIVRWFTIWRRG